MYFFNQRMAFSGGLYVYTIVFSTAILGVLCSDVDLRLKRGRGVTRGDMSFVVKIMVEQNRVCSGVLVGKRTVLTSSQCMKFGEIESYSIILRTRNCYTRRCEERRKVDGITELLFKDEDVILLRLDRIIDKKKYRTMKRLSEEKDFEKISKCKIVSYSADDQSLKEADVTILPVERCTRSEGYKFLCLDVVKAAACKEDTGSPVLCKYDNRWHVTGLLAIEENCKKDSVKAILVPYFKAAILEVLYKDTGKEPSWNGLRAFFSEDPSVAFQRIPRTRLEAEENGWVKFAPGTGCNGKGKFRGERYIKENDMCMIAIYDNGGYVAGMQIGWPKDYSPNPNDFPYEKFKNKMVIKDNGDYFITAYFVDPATICNGRTATDFALEGTGTGLRIQTGLNPVSDYMLIPQTQEDVDKTMWTKSPCFPSMGLHYWFNITKVMDCEDTYPFFLLYNDGLLNAFGWAVPINLDGVTKVIEHPSPAFYPAFMDPVPDCLYGLGTMSTLHIYFTETPYDISC